MKTMSSPICVILSDVHYSLTTLPLADAATRQAIVKANELDVPLVVSGDLHDTKANLRGECVNAMIETFKLCAKKPYILRGNHDSLNEKSIEHSLNFLAPYATIVDDFGYYQELDSFLIAYQHDTERMTNILRNMLPGTRLIIHQGVQGTIAGDYVIDKSAMPKEAFKDFRTISGHYHTRQDIKCGRPRQDAVGLFSYVGNPYTLTFGEANDPRKGFQILMDNNLLEFVPTNLRRHVIFNIQLIGSNYQITGKTPLEDLGSGDLVWAKFTGTKEQIMTINRDKFLKACDLPPTSRLDFIPTDTKTQAPETKDQTQGDLLDSLIDSLSNTSDERKLRLKELWKNSICG